MQLATSSIIGSLFNFPITARPIWKVKESTWP